MYSRIAVAAVTQAFMNQFLGLILRYHTVSLMGLHLPPRLHFGAEYQGRQNRLVTFENLEMKRS